MNNLLLDTNILHQEGLNSRNMQLLRRLIEASHCVVHVPEIVKREFITKKIYESKEKIQNTIKNLAYIDKFIDDSSELKKKQIDILSRVKILESEIEKQLIKDFSNWENEYSIRIIPFDPNSMSQVIDDYFTGHGVYRRPKSREDIPDAIINTSIDELIETLGNLDIAIKDGTFKKFLQRNKKVRVFDSLEEYIETDSNKEIFSQLDAKTKNSEKIIEYLSSVPIAGAISFYK